MAEARARIRQTRLLIDGKLTGGEGVAESILDPATGMEIAKVLEATREQVEAAVGASLDTRACGRRASNITV